MVTFRQATEADKEFLYQLHVAAMGEYVAATWGWHEDWQREYFNRKWDPQTQQIIQVRGQDAGVLVLHWEPQRILLELIELLPIFQGHGVGTAVIRNLQQEARLQKLPIILTVLKANQPAHRLYTRLGFRVTEEREERYVMAWLP